MTLARTERDRKSDASGAKRQKLNKKNNQVDQTIYTWNDLNVKARITLLFSQQSISETERSVSTIQLLTWINQLVQQLNQQLHLVNYHSTAGRYVGRSSWIHILTLCKCSWANCSRVNVHLTQEQLVDPTVEWCKHSISPEVSNNLEELTHFNC